MKNTSMPHTSTHTVSAAIHNFGTISSVVGGVGAAGVAAVAAWEASSAKPGAQTNHADPSTRPRVRHHRTRGHEHIMRLQKGYQRRKGAPPQGLDLPCIRDVLTASEPPKFFWEQRPCRTPCPICARPSFVGMLLLPRLCFLPVFRDLPPTRNRSNTSSPKPRRLGAARFQSIAVRRKQASSVRLVPTSPRRTGFQ
jgi:hypothetical protein